MWSWRFRLLAWIYRFIIKPLGSAEPVRRRRTHKLQIVFESKSEDIPGPGQSGGRSARLVERLPKLDK